MAKAIKTLITAVLSSVLVVTIFIHIASALDISITGVSYKTTSINTSIATIKAFAGGDCSIGGGGSGSGGAATLSVNISASTPSAEISTNDAGNGNHIQVVCGYDTWSLTEEINSGSTTNLVGITNSTIGFTPWTSGSTVSTFTNKTWGMKYTEVTPQAGNAVTATSYHAVPAYGSPLTIASGIATSGYKIQQTFGAKTDGSVRADTYRTTVLYTLTGINIPSPFSCAPNGYYNGSTWTQYNGVDHGHIGIMQNVTSANTADWNIGDYATVTDIRNDQDYVICKLADENIWMLNNLKLGSTTEDTLLTPADTNITSNWNLPQLVTSGFAGNDVPKAYGPIPGSTDNIADETFYGFLYNWCAATAGGTASGGSNTCTAYSVMPDDATGDICPANWRLPTGGPTGEFAWLYAKMDNPSATSPSTDTVYIYGLNWRFTGPWRGVGAGRHNGSSFYMQGGSSTWWSSSHYPGYSTSVYVFLDGYYHRGFGFSVRCLVK